MVSYFLQDNTPAHKAQNTGQKICDFSSKLMELPPYSSDLATSNYHLFPQSKTLQGKNFTTVHSSVFPNSSVRVAIRGCTITKFLYIFQQSCPTYPTNLTASPFCKASKPGTFKHPFTHSQATTEHLIMLWVNNFIFCLSLHHTFSLLLHGMNITNLKRYSMMIDNERRIQ